MKASDFDYELSESAIAQIPVEPRDAARLMVHHAPVDTTAHQRVSDLPDILRSGDLLVVNDTRVRPARLFGTRASGGQVELLLLAPEGPPAHWRAFVRPAKRISIGDVITLEGGALRARAVSRTLDDAGRPGAEWLFGMEHDTRFTSFDAALESAGHMPLPPYIRRARQGDAHEEQDRERYQTVFAACSGAVAAPTAGLHFTPDLIRRLGERGIEIAPVTLHVGVGTFQPMQTDDLSEHRMHAEEYVLTQSTVDAVLRTRARGGRVVAVGTTSARVLESCADEQGHLTAGAGSTRLFIAPGRPFRVIDGLMTNFHLPRSTLLVLVAALVGRERVLRLYAEAMERGYRFYSYGDAQLYLL